MSSQNDPLKDLGLDSKADSKLNDTKASDTNLDVASLTGDIESALSNLNKA